jgi:beta-glucosidase
MPLAAMTRDRLRLSAADIAATPTRRDRGSRVAIALGFSVLAGLLLAAQPSAPPAYLDPHVPLERRVNDLVGRMTLDEKISQMMDHAPAIPRLQVPEYNWWNEALHGVARAGLATVFPQAIGFAATWDDELVHRMASAISDEARAKHHDALRKGNHDRYLGLTIWSPNINLFRDPRWGRGQETYGEDPFLTGHLAIDFVRGLQGDDPTYLKTVSTVKHFAVHSGPEPERHTFDAVVDERTLHEDYLRQFQTAIQKGGAYSLMCAYNRVNGQPACSKEMLLADTLRGAWRFPGYVVSDCGAVEDIYQRHKVVKTGADAAAAAVKAGTDLECGNTAYRQLGEAVRQGLIDEARIDTAVKRLFTARFRLGMFDPPSMVPYAQIPMANVDSPEHRALALQVARESIVLLENQGNVLPLRKDIGTLAVIGPDADQWRMLLGNYNGIPSDPITPLRGIREAVGPKTKVLFAPGSDLAEGFPVYDVVPAQVLFTPDGQPGLQVEYFGTGAMTGTPVATGVDSTVDANWREGAPKPGMDPDDFAVRWTGTLRPSRSGGYRLGLIGTVKYRLYVDDKLLFESQYPQHEGEFPDPRPTYTQAIDLQAARDYRLRVEGVESYGAADLQLLWAPPGDLLESDALDAARAADASILFLGLSPRLEGEEMPVSVPGFRGGDRTAIELPAPQQRLLEHVAALRKPTVVVLLSGSALAIDSARQHVPAVVEAWYPGQAGGTAIADVLFGSYNPAGRLPVTFYRATSDLPPFDDYSMAGRTYRYFTGTALYPFGHGLSYTTFRYAHLRTSAPELRAGGEIAVSVDVTNTGARAGDEVVQLYVQHVGSAVPRPAIELRGYTRLTLMPGETRTVVLPLRADDLAYWDVGAHTWTTEADRIRIRVGGSSTDLRVDTTVAVQAR